MKLAPRWVDRAGLDDRRSEALAAEAGVHTTLEGVLQWALAKGREVQLVEVVTQDEFTHDVVLSYSDGVWLVYDTT